MTFRKYGQSMVILFLIQLIYLPSSKYLMAVFFKNNTQNY
ncbi:hypothetical protein D922_03147 [Enterococcus faecalis 06-MB-DW-09]|nr:hypothetical protein D922_03147 [Enterococcus faecalis 06-MB-DW-09]